MDYRIEIVFLYFAIVAIFAIAFGRRIRVCVGRSGLRVDVPGRIARRHDRKRRTSATRDQSPG